MTNRFSLCGCADALLASGGLSCLDVALASALVVQIWKSSGAVGWKSLQSKVTVPEKMTYSDLAALEAGAQWGFSLTCDKRVASTAISSHSARKFVIQINAPAMIEIRQREASRKGEAGLQGPYARQCKAAM